jgi:hypothetical protein
MATSPPTAADLPAQPIIDALPPPASPAYPMAVARSSATVTMQDVFGKTPFPWQEKVIAHMNLMRAPRRGVPPATILLRQPTGGGESMVRDNFAAAHGGIHWSISPLLALTA